jgi:protein-S-isoprenylcysteine O-methyltransferase Ste14
VTTRSASTPRLRLTLAYYVLLVGATAVAGRVAISPPLDAMLGFAAILLVSIGTLGRIWASVFIAGRKDAELVTLGPYARSRHPLYLFSFVGGLGIGIATRSLVLTLVTLAVLAMLHVHAVSKEERTLAARHGGAFADYRGQVPRWWPRPVRSTLPETVSVSPGILWKAFVDAASFLLLYGLVETVRAFRMAGLLPTLVWLP